MGHGEPLPTYLGSRRLLRTGMIADILVKRGHEVLWWSSNFDHVQKTLRSNGSVKQNVRPGYDIFPLKGRSYVRNVSPKRILHNRDVRKEFNRLSAGEAKPDIILCCLPILEFCQAAVEIGEKWGVPVIIDVRDFWPDVIVDAVPKWLRFMARLACAPMYRDFRFAILRATAICGISDSAVDWALNHVGRQKTDYDRSFPLSYQIRDISENEVTKSNDYWTALGYPLGHAYFLAIFVGQLSSRYEIQTVIKAAKILQTQKQNHFKFIICGKGEALTRLKRQAANLDNVIFTGWINYSQIRSLMQRASVGLIPYRSSLDFSRSVPNKVAEYFSAGLPVISSVHGDLSRLLEAEHCGVTYENENARELAEIVMDLSSDKVRANKVSENASRVFDRYRAENVYGEYCDYLEEMAQRGC